MSIAAGPPSGVVEGSREEKASVLMDFLDAQGVGGLTLSSELSYTSPRYGWTCDTVSQFEIILADGSVVEVDSVSRPDLMWALRGGGNHFGSEYFRFHSPPLGLARCTLSQD